MPGNPVDRGNQPLSSYLLRIITALVAAGGGELRIPAMSIIDGEGQGVIRHYDKLTKELVLRLAPVGSEALFVKDGGQWPVEDSVNQSSEAAPTLQPSRAAASMSRLSDEQLADLEMSRERERLSREAEAALLSFPEAPVSASARQRPPTSRSAVREPFFKR